MSWYLLRTAYRQEFNVEHTLDGMGIEPYCPRMPIDRRTGKHSKLTVEPAYPRYLFFSAVPGTDDFHAIGAVKGSFGIVSLTKKDGFYVPSVIHDSEIAYLKSLHDDQNVINVWKTDYVEGDRIRFKIGGFKDYQGVYQSIRGKTGEERVSILIDSLSGQRLIEAGLKDIEPA